MVGKRRMFGWHRRSLCRAAAGSPRANGVIPPHHDSPIPPALIGFRRLRHTHFGRATQFSSLPYSRTFASIRGSLPANDITRVAQAQPVSRSGRKPKGERRDSIAPGLGNTACTPRLPAPSAHALRTCYPERFCCLSHLCGYEFDDRGTIR